MAFSLKSFQETLQDVKDARAWYHSIGIPTDNTRLQLIEERITALREALESEPPEKVVERWATAETYYVLSDGASFGRIKREISKVGPNLMPKRDRPSVLGQPNTSRFRGNTSSVGPREVAALGDFSFVAT